jgi:hypothetical protein
MIPHRNGFNNLERLADKQMPHPSTKSHPVQQKRRSEFESHPARLAATCLGEAGMLSRQRGSIESKDIFRLCQTFDKRK